MATGAVEGRKLLIGDIIRRAAEIGDLAIGLQAKLLRVIEQGEILPVGATTPFIVDVRLIASTNQKLRPAVEEKRFREDLYYRLNVFGIEIPPLRERREDIPSLVDHFIRILNLELKKRFKGATSGTLRLLMSLAWNGNVRELANVIEHAMIIGEGDWIEEAHLPRSLREGTEEATVVGDDLREAMRAYERTHVRGVLAKLDPDKRAAADRLGISLSSLYRKIEELGIGLDQEAHTEIP